MTANDTPTWLDEAFASYQPSSMSTATWERFRADAFELVRQLSPNDARAARKCLSRLTVFLADLVGARPEATLDDLLTREQVQGHLQRALADGAAGKTIENRQGTLNAMLRVKCGGPQPRQTARGPERRLVPHTVAELRTAAAAALADGRPAGADFARMVACVLGGVSLPSRTDDRKVEMADDGKGVTVNGQRFDNAGLPAVPTGELRFADVERGRAFAQRELGFRLDLRRAALTALVVQVASQPAVEVLTLPDVGRDRLTAAAAACDPADQDAVRRLLRAAALPSAAVSG